MQMDHGMGIKDMSCEPMLFERVVPAVIEYGGEPPTYVASDEAIAELSKSVDEVLDEAFESLAKEHAKTAYCVPPMAAVNSIGDRTDVHHFEQHADRHLVAVMDNGDRVDLGFDPDMPKGWGRTVTSTLIDLTTAEFDPLCILYDGVSLRDLLEWDRRRRQDDSGRDLRWGGEPTDAQRAAISAHWSAELRRKVDAAKERERCAVSVQNEEE
jgi:hypothetical protein